jgi:hypothetical protein
MLTSDATRSAVAAAIVDVPRQEVRRGGGMSAQESGQLVHLHVVSVERARRACR